MGAGPGDPDLLTVGGASALRKADIVLYDELSSSELLSWVKPTAQCINVGRRGHEQPTRTQEDVNALIIAHAKEGRTVVRLKGGDPFIFGRGGEEASACVKAGVPFDVVPGVTSALAAPAYAGIPLTDRRHAASFAVVTGHKDPGRAAEATRWSELGRAVDTLVILMGMRSLPSLLSRIVEGGKPASTPAAAVMNGTLPEQKVVTGTLATLAEEVEKAGLGAPAAIVVGSVVELRETLSWWEARPLFGLRTLITRPRNQSGELAAALRSAGAVPVIQPMIELRDLSDEGSLAKIKSVISRVETYDDIVFSSTNAVHFFVHALKLFDRMDVLTRLKARILCMGRKTSEAAFEAGLSVHLSLQGGQGDAHSLLEEILKSMPVKGRRVLVPRSDIGRLVLSSGLENEGALVDAPVFYRNVRPDVDEEALRSEIRAGELPILTFTSPSAVDHFVSLMDEDTRAACHRCIIVAIGRTTASALRSAGIPPNVIPSQPGTDEMVVALAQYKIQDA